MTDVQTTQQRVRRPKRDKVHRVADDVVTANSLATHLGCSRQNIGRLTAEAIIERRADGHYDQTASRLRYIKHLRTSSRTVRSEADSQHVLAKAQMLQIKIMQQQGKLVLREDANALLDEVCGVVLTHLSGLGARCSRDMVVRRIDGLDGSGGLGANSAVVIDGGRTVTDSDSTTLAWRRSPSRTSCPARTRWHSTTPIRRPTATSRRQQLGRSDADVSGIYRDVGAVAGGAAGGDYNNTRTIRPRRQPHHELCGQRWHLEQYYEHEDGQHHADRHAADGNGHGREDAWTEASGLGGNSPVVIDGGVTVADLDNTTLPRRRCRSRAISSRAEDVLSFANTGATMGNIAAAQHGAGRDDADLGGGNRRPWRSGRRRCGRCSTRTARTTRRRRRARSASWSTTARRNVEHGDLDGQRDGGGTTADGVGRRAGRRLHGERRRRTRRGDRRRDHGGGLDNTTLASATVSISGTCERARTCCRSRTCAARWATSRRVQRRDRA